MTYSDFTVKFRTQRCAIWFKWLEEKSERRGRIDILTGCNVGSRNIIPATRNPGKISTSHRLVKMTKDAAASRIGLGSLTTAGEFWAAAQSQRDFETMLPNRPFAFPIIRPYFPSLDSFHFHPNEFMTNLLFWPRKKRS
jgi:hypothetical protein